jgi:aspartyl-tRNA(Asn)/glutamyl-tRNA(Gln) amidotransferase subunit B
LSAEDAIALTNNDARIPHYFQGAVHAAHMSGEQYSAAAAKLCANWIINEYLPRQSEDRDAFPDVSIIEGVSDGTMGHLIRRMREGVINAKTAKDLFQKFWSESRDKRFSVHGGYPERIDQMIEEGGLRQISDAGALEKMVDEVIAANAQQVADYRGGKEKAFNSLVGQVMKASRGKANPQQVSDILKRKLAAA